MTTLLALVQSACSEINIPRPTALFTSTDDTAIQLINLANREGMEFSQIANKNGGWQELHKEYTFTTNAISGLTGTITAGSPVITNISNTAGISAISWGISGNGISNAAFVKSVDSGTQITMNIAASISGTGVVLSIGQIGYSMPSDLEYFLTQTFWDGSYRWQLLGPMEAQEKNVIKYGISPVGPRRRFWILNNLMYINPIPTNTTDFLAYDYQSNAWCSSSGGVPQQSFQADTDTYILDNNCFTLGIKWRFLRAKGLDYTQEKEDYDRATSRVLSRNGSGRDLPLDSQATSLRLLSSANVPDTGFGT